MSRSGSQGVKIFTPAEECRLGRHAFDTSAADHGEVQRCAHGRYWMFYRHPSWVPIGSRGYWWRLEWWQHPVWWWRAHRAMRDVRRRGVAS